MTVTATPAFTQAPLLGVVQVATANSNRDGSTGTYSSVVSAGSNGSLVDCIKFKAITTTVAGTLRIYYSANASTSWRLIAEVLTAGATVSGIVPAEDLIWTPPGGLPLGLPASSGLKFSIENGSETWNCCVLGGVL